MGVLPHNGTETLRHRAFKGAGWSIIGAVLSQGLGFLCMLIVARMLKPELFGEFSTIRTTTAMFGVFAGFGLGYTASKHISEYRNVDPHRAGRMWGLVDITAMTTSFVVSCLIFFFSSFIATEILKAPQLGLMLKISSVTVFFNTMIWVQNFTLGGFEAFKRVAIVEISRGILYFPILIIGTFIWGVQGAVVGLSLVSIGGFIVSKRMLALESRKQSIYIDRRGGFKEAGILLRFTLPSLSSSIIAIVGQWVCVAMLVRQVDGMVQNGLLNAANQWPEIIAFLPMTLGNPVVSIMSNIYGEGKYRQFKKLVCANMGLIGGLTIVLGLFMALLAPYLIRIYGEEYSSAVRLLQIGCATVIFRGLSRMTTQILVAMGRVRIELLFSLLRILTLLIIWYTLLSYGALGLAISFFTSFLFLFVIQGGYALRAVWRLKS